MNRHEAVYKELLWILEDKGDFCILFLLIFLFRFYYVVDFILGSPTVRSASTLALGLHVLMINSFIHMGAQGICLTRL